MSFSYQPSWRARPWIRGPLAAPGRLERAAGRPETVVDRPFSQKAEITNERYGTNNDGAPILCPPTHSAKRTRWTCSIAFSKHGSSGDPPRV